MKKIFWPLQENVISSNERKKLSNFILNTKRFTQFTEVDKFEKAYSKWQKCKYSIYVNSGSSANLLIVQSSKEIYNWKDGDEIIVDLTGSDIGTSIKISSVKLPENVIPTITDRDFVVATVAPPTIVKEPVKPAEEAAAAPAPSPEEVTTDVYVSY